MAKTLSLKNAGVAGPTNSRVYLQSNTPVYYDGAGKVVHDTGVTIVAENSSHDACAVVINSEQISALIEFLEPYAQKNPRILVKMIERGET